MIEPVAYLGPEGTFTHEAAQVLFSESQYRHVPRTSIVDVLTSVNQNECAYGVVPVENAIEGSVTLTLDWLIHHVKVPITAELIYPISQYLMVHPSQAHRSWKDYTRVISHPQAVAQTRIHVRKYLPQAAITFVDSTADAARQVQEHSDQPWVAIGTQSAQKLYSLEMLSEKVEDYPNNYTRFIVVGKEIRELKASPSLTKSSFLVTLPSDFPGALYRVLQSFAGQGVNLSRIESRPTKKKLGAYYFYIDAEKEWNHPSVTRAIQEVEAWDCKVRLLGSYPAYTFSQIKSFQSVDNTK
ncbi:prephenate dehydratase [Kroppenstedtia pulmonis]|uniref:Prephenate dehydratase n=1 Tax=Kroppenstedtia pulmonis TaxID=1380685 RepID=A0A7D4CLV3_9BACL|nr:prephenate dehydratase [Kroppenstedtia pulmonis]QKG84118.1 prephenate dehydratase [Kroppenstedtia pulmonis]